MAEKKNTNKILTIGIVLILAIAAIVVIYVNLPQEKSENDNQTGGEFSDDTSDNDTEKPNTTLVVNYNNTEYEYNFEELENLQSTTGTARTLKSRPFFKSNSIIIEPPMNETADQYTGVEISKIIENVQNLPETYNVTLYAPDDYNTTFNNSELEGNIITYNETGNETQVEVSVILAYKQNGEYLPEDDGSLMVAIVGEEPISLSNIWVKSVVSIDITE